MTPFNSEVVFIFEVVAIIEVLAIFEIVLIFWTHTATVCDNLKGQLHQESSRIISIHGLASATTRATSAEPLT